MLSLPRDCPVTLNLLGANVILFIAQFVSQDFVTNIGLLYGPYVERGEFWRVLSSGFLHGGVIHLAFNMYLLYVMGPQLERNLGSTRFSLMYFGALVGGSLFVLTFAFNQPTLGASGAVLGLAGAMFVALSSRGVSAKDSPFFGLVVINLLLPLLVPGISFWGHFGGVLVGALMAFVMVWLPERSRGAKPFRNISLGVAILILLVVACFLVV